MHTNPEEANLYNSSIVSPKDKKENILSNLKSKINKIFNNKEKGNSRRTVFEKINSEENNSTKKSILEKFTQQELYSIIKEFMPHFANFNFDTSEAIDMIVELATKYKITKEKINFFVTLLNSSLFTIKNKLPNKINKVNQKPVNYVNKNDDFKAGIILSSIKFVSNKDVLNLFTLNKTIYAKLSKKVYRKLLDNKNCNLKIRLQIWNILLKVVN